MCFEYYLWGIETSQKTLNLLQNCSLNTTYEELKLVQRWYITRTAFALNTTYEELKHNNKYIVGKVQRNFEYYLWGIETMLQFILRCKIRQLWILPMRNWNQIRSFKKKYYVNFEYYLWGIETDKQGLYMHSLLKLWILPMRNWNSIVDFNKSLIKVFEYYLWGIETFDSKFFYLFVS